jgi:hypothetical protein
MTRLAATRQIVEQFKCAGLCACRDMQRNLSIDLYLPGTVIPRSAELNISDNDNLPSERGICCPYSLSESLKLLTWDRRNFIRIDSSGGVNGATY